MNSFILLQLLLCVPVVLLVSFYLYYKYCFTYWKRHGLQSSQPSFPFGNLGKSVVGKESIYTRLQHLYNEFKARGLKHAGVYFFNGPIYFPLDRDIIKRILVTDFNYFTDRGMYGNADKFPLSWHISSMKGEQWRHIRSKMSSNFTSGKIKALCPTIQKQCNILINSISVNKDREIEMKELLLRFTVDVIGACSFGIDTNCLSNPNAEFSIIINKILNHSRWELTKVAIEAGLKNPGNIEKSSYDDKKIENFFSNLICSTIKYRESNNVVRNDFLNMLMELRNEVTLEEIIAQSYLFFVVYGLKTSSFTMCYCLHELAQNQDIQDELRDEIYKNLGNDCSKFQYDNLMSLPLLDKVIKETMRKYPQLPMLNRECVKDYEIPGSNVVLKKGTPVIISLLALHRDADYFPEPMEFRPSRFNEDNTILPYSYLPFGDGPRNCIGLRFGLLMTKLGVASLLSKFRFLPSSNPLTKEQDLKIDPSTSTILYNVPNGVYAHVKAL